MIVESPKKTKRELRADKLKQFIERMPAELVKRDCLMFDTRPVHLQAPCRGNMRYPTAPTEFEVQAFLYIELRKMGYNARGEVSVYNNRARFDIAIYPHGTNLKIPLRIIEVKDVSQSLRHSSRCGKQASRYYCEFGIPVDLVCGMKAAREYLERIGGVLPLPAGSVRP
jgi:hypothetical protein